MSQVSYETDDFEERDWHNELKAELGDKFVGCIIRGNEVIEVHLKSDLTIPEIAQVEGIIKKTIHKREQP